MGSEPGQARRPGAVDDAAEVADTHKAPA